MVESDTNDQQL